MPCFSGNELTVVDDFLQGDAVPRCVLLIARDVESGAMAVRTEDAVHGNGISTYSSQSW